MPNNPRNQRNPITDLYNMMTGLGKVAGREGVRQLGPAAANVAGGISELGQGVGRALQQLPSDLSSLGGWIGDTSSAAGGMAYDALLGQDKAMAAPLPPRPPAQSIPEGPMQMDHFDLMNNLAGSLPDLPTQLEGLVQPTPGFEPDYAGAAATDPLEEILASDPEAYKTFAGVRDVGRQMEAQMLARKQQMAQQQAAQKEADRQLAVESFTPSSYGFRGDSPMAGMGPDYTQYPDARAQADQMVEQALRDPRRLSQRGDPTGLGDRMARLDAVSPLPEPELPAGLDPQRIQAAREALMQRMEARGESLQNAPTPEGQEAQRAMRAQTVAAQKDRQSGKDIRRMAARMNRFNVDPMQAMIAQQMAGGGGGGDGSMNPAMAAMIYGPEAAAKMQIAGQQNALGNAELTMKERIAQMELEQRRMDARTQHRQWRMDRGDRNRQFDVTDRRMGKEFDARADERAGERATANEQHLERMKAMALQAEAQGNTAKADMIRAEAAKMEAENNAKRAEYENPEVQMRAKVGAAQGLRDQGLDTTGGRLPVGEQPSPVAGVTSGVYGALLEGYQNDAFDEVWGPSYGNFAPGVPFYTGDFRDERQAYVDWAVKSGLASVDQAGAVYDRITGATPAPKQPAAQPVAAPGGPVYPNPGEQPDAYRKRRAAQPGLRDSASILDLMMQRLA